MSRQAVTTPAVIPISRSQRPPDTAGMSGIYILMVQSILHDCLTVVSFPDPLLFCLKVKGKNEPNVTGC